MKFNIVKKVYGRKRFLKSRNVIAMNSWTAEVNLILNFLEQKSHLQRVGGQIIFCFENLNSQPFIMVEVLGLPPVIDSNCPVLVDCEASSFYSFNLDSNASNVKIDEIISQKDYLLNLLNSQSKLEPFSDSFNIVLRDYKIELQFFKQNDYSQIRL